MPKVRLALAFLAVALSFSSGLIGHVGPMGDLYSPWYGTRVMMVQKSNPYAEQVSHDIQIAYYGHILSPAEHKDEQRFAYPAYTALLLWPIAFLKFSTVRSVGLLALILLAAAAAFYSIQLSGWKMSRTDQLAAVLLALSTAPLMRTLRLEQLGTLVVLLLVASLVAVSRGYLITAGVLLAMATIKPQMAVLPVVWLMAWGLRKFPERRNLVLSFLGTMALLVAAPEFIIRGWLFSFINQLQAYTGYAQSNSWFTLLAGNTVGTLAALVVAGLTARALYKHLDAAADSWRFCVCSALTMGVASFVVPTLGTLNSMMMLLPAAFVVLRNFNTLNRWLRVLILGCLAWTPGMALVTFIIDNGTVRFIQMSPGFLLACTFTILLALRFEKILTLEARFRHPNELPNIGDPLQRQAECQ